MSNPSNLVSRLYNARYFPNCEFLDSAISHNLSYVWQSIWSSKFVVRGGSKWSIGSGTNILVWRHQWTFVNAKLDNLWPMNESVSSLKVSNLMFPNRKLWNLDLIQPLFRDN